MGHSIVDEVIRKTLEADHDLMWSFLDKASSWKNIVQL